MIQMEDDHHLESIPLNQPRPEFVLPWALAVAACVAGAVATAHKTPLSLIVGGVILAGGGLLALIAKLMLGDRQQLVQKGPYRLVRHPFYLGVLVMLAGVVVATRSLVGAVLFLPALVVTLTRAKREETNLRLLFGAAHDEYRRRVQFILPLWKHRRR